MLRSCRILTQYDSIDHFIKWLHTQFPDDVGRVTATGIIRYWIDHYRSDFEAKDEGKMKYEEFKKMVDDWILQEMEFQKKNWVFGLEFMKTWKPSEFEVKGEENG